MSRTDKSSPKFNIVSVKKFGAIAGLLCCFFLAGVVVGCYASLRLPSCHRNQGTQHVNQMASNASDAFDQVQEFDPYPTEFMSLHGTNFDFNKKFEDVPEFLIKSSLVPEHHASYLTKKFNLSDTDTLVIHNYHINSPTYDTAKNNSVRFHLGGELLIEEYFVDLSFPYLFNGDFKDRLVLIRDRVKNLDIDSIAGAVILTPHNVFSTHWAYFLENIGAKAFLFYDEDSLKHCFEKRPHKKGKPINYWGDPSTPDCPAIDGVYSVPEEEMNLLRIPFEIISCEAVLRILPHLYLKSQKLTAEFNLATKLQSSVISNLLVSFHGNKDPGTSIIIGASRNNLIGTRRLMKLLQMTSLAIHSDHLRWTPGYTIRFLSWGSHSFGMFEFFETYRSVWKDKVIMYIDLDNHYGDDDVHFMASSSLKDFLKRAAEQAQQKITTTHSMTIKNSNEFLLGGLLFEQEMGVPYIQSICDDDEKYEGQVLRTLGVVITSAADAGLVQISLSKTVVDVLKAIKKLIQLFPIVGKQIPALIKMSQQFRTSADSFESFTRSSLAFRSEIWLKIVNDVIIKAENSLRRLLHRLKSLLANPVLQLAIETNVTYMDSRLLQPFCRMKNVPLKHNITTKTCILYEASVIMSKLQNAMKIISPPE